MNLVDPDGNDPKFWKTLKFSISHPKIAMAIGYSKTRGTNISSSASQFAKAGKVLQYTQPQSNEKEIIDEGTEKGAFRHALWQATIMSRYGYNIARQVGDAHENNADVDLSQRAFDNYSEADTVVDLLNNIIGRNVGGFNRGASIRELAFIILDIFVDEGLFTASQNENGIWSVNRTKITEEQYEQMKETFLIIDEYGRKKQE